MLFAGMKRNPKLFDSIWKVQGDTVIALQDCKILIPFDFLKNKMAIIAGRIQIAAICAVCSGNEFAILNGTAMITINPDDTRQVKIDNQVYLQFDFLKGSTVIPTLGSIKDSDLVYAIYKYFYNAGRVPGYMNADDLGRAMLLHKEWGGINISPDNTPFELVTSMICRDAKNKMVFYRHTDMKQLPVIIPFKSVLYNARSTTAKLLGNNLDDGFTSALIYPSTEPDRLENMLRQ